MISPVAAAFKAVADRLSTSASPWGAPIWASRYWPVVAPSGAQRPYVVYSISAGQRRYITHTIDAELDVLIKACSEDMAIAEQCAAAIATRFDDSGIFDVRTPSLVGLGGWAIKTVTQSKIISYMDLVAGKPVYFSGFIYVFTMEVV